MSDSSKILTFLLVPTTLVLFYVANGSPRLSVKSKSKGQASTIQNCVYLPNTGDYYDTPSRNLLDMTIGKDWYTPPDQPGVMYGQLPSGEISIRYQNPLAKQ